MSFFRKLPRRTAWWALGIFVGLLVVGRLLLNPLLAHRTQEILDSIDGYHASFEGISISLYKLSYSIEGLKLTQVPPPPGVAEDRPLLYAKRVQVGLHWRSLLDRRQFVGAVEVDDPRLDAVAVKGKFRLGDELVGDKLKQLSLLDVDRFEVKRADFAFSDDAAKPSIRLHDLDGTLENIDSIGQPTTLAASGTLQQSGLVSIFVTADPGAKELGFAGRASVEGLKVSEAGSFLAQKPDAASGGGSLDLVAEFDGHRGRITGAVRPSFKEGRSRPARLIVKPWVADPSLRLFSERAAARGGAVPMQGAVTPGSQLGPTVWGVLRNAFVTGIESSVARAPASAPVGKAPPNRSRR
jgi:hypothetical protein